MTTNPYQSSDAAASPPAVQPPVQDALIWKLVRSVLGIIAGVVVGVIVVALVEAPGSIIHTVPPGVNLNDPQALRKLAAGVPLASLLWFAAAGALGPLVGSFVTTAIARWASFGHGMFIAAVFLTLNVMKLNSFPHPTWMALVGVLGPLASGWIGSAVAEWLFSSKTPDPRPDPKPYDMRRKNMAC